MATTILIIGEPGTGKSTALRTLAPEETFLINVLGKPLPFRGWKKKYVKAEEGKGNLFQSDSSMHIIKALKYINEKRPDIKTIIIDDFQYIMGNEFMRRASEKGWEKFTEIAQSAWKVVLEAQFCRNDLNIFFLSHSETDQFGKTKCKTIGKMLDEKISLEGMFTIILSSVVVDEHYYFQTKNDGAIIAKTPMDMFSEKYIDNDLFVINNAINEYFDQDVEM